MTPFEETVENQRRAAAPARSAFVSANAGAGKTRVLTDRVARLLLDEVDPAKVLCITFTKAAAAEMAGRLYKLLGEWSLADDKDLNEALDALEGGRKNRTLEKLAEARRLFARAIETPGGLKIQTIHSFCESVLKRFPLEAGVTPGFTVLEDDAAAAMAGQAIDGLGNEGESGAVHVALARLTERFAPDALRDALKTPLLARQNLHALVARPGALETACEEVARLLGVNPADTEEAVIKQIAASLDRGLMARAREALAHGGPTAKKYAENQLTAYANAATPADAVAAVRTYFLTESDTPRDKLCDAPVKKIDPTLNDALTDAQVRFHEQINTLKSVAIYRDTANFLTLIDAALSHYANLKEQRAGLDYDDLIIATNALLADRERNAWVMYKLDAGLEHILLDEAQDTSPGQWDIVEGPLTEFFAGAGARSDGRTFFAVGDKKQSIYSFQGADAGLFNAKQADLGKRIAAADHAFENVPLTLSFRTTAPVLAFVDALFADKQALEGVADETLRHGVNRAGEAGRVELWPLTPKPDKKETKAWDAPVDAVSEDSPTTVLCGHIAAEIKAWIGAETLQSRARAVEAGDIIILVQSRGPLFHQMINALARSGVPVAGADRLKLLEDPAVEDLLAYARCVLLDEDDLSLAEILKSPFFGLDDADLFDLAYDRKHSLWRTLQKRARERRAWTQAVDEISAARRTAQKEGAYAFFSHILESGAPSGRTRLYGRLSDASREPIDEFLRQALDYEAGHPRSLQGFISWAEKNAGEIKRELEQASDAVRVMTVHGAKGLEGDIVFLLDAHKPPNTKTGSVLPAPSEKLAANIPVLCRVKHDASAAVQALYDEAKREKYEEYRRLLYVAATRARDRLYICGVEDKNSKNRQKKPTAEKSWYALAEDAFGRLDDVQSEAHSGWAGDVLSVECPQTKKVKKKQSDAPFAPPEAPDWFGARAPAEQPILRLSPSKLADDAEASAEPAVYAPLAGGDPYFRGRVLHRLLELLPDLPHEARNEAAARLLQKLAPDIDAAEQERWRKEAMAVLSEPTFADVFAPEGRAEVSIAGAPAGLRGDQIISGQIDRLLVTETRVLVIDYKTNRPPPAKAEDVAASYLAQMAAYRALLREIYPGRRIDSALLWTFEATLMPLPDTLLDHAFARLCA